MVKLVRGWGLKKRVIKLWAGQGAFDSEQYPATAVNKTINGLRFRFVAHLIDFPSYFVYILSLYITYYQNMSNFQYTY